MEGTTHVKNRKEGHFRRKEWHVQREMIRLEIGQTRSVRAWHRSHDKHFKFYPTKRKLLKNFLMQKKYMELFIF